MNKFKISLYILIGIILMGSTNVVKINAAKADVMPFYFSIFEGRYTPSRYYDVNVNSSVSYKHYAGNNKIDKSAYVIHSTSSLNFYQFLGGAHNSDIRYSPTKLHMEYQRTPYANYAPKDEHYGHVFYGSRQNKWDGRGEISGSWACDDKFGK